MKISENTPLTIGVIISLIGGIGFITKTSYVADATAESQKIVIEKQDKYNDSMSQMREDLSILKHDVSEIKRMLKEERE